MKIGRKNNPVVTFHPGLILVGATGDDPDTIMRGQHCLKIILIERVRGYAEKGLPRPLMEMEEKSRRAILFHVTSCQRQMADKDGQAGLF